MVTVAKASEDVPSVWTKDHVRFSQLSNLKTFFLNSFKFYDKSSEFFHEINVYNRQFIIDNLSVRNHLLLICEYGYK